MINDLFKVILSILAISLVFVVISALRSCDRNLDGNLSLDRIEKERVRVKEKFEGAQDYDEICDIFNKQFCAD